MGYLEKKLQAIISTLDAWKKKTGNLYIMTGNSAPSPFVASLYENGALFKAGEPYLSFDNTNGWTQGSVGSGAYFGANINFGKNVKIAKINPIITAASYGAGGSITYKIEIKLPNNSYQEVFSTTLNQGTTYNTQITLTSIQQVECIGVRHRGIWKTGDLTPVQLKELQVTEWYEKG